MSVDTKTISDAMFQMVEEVAGTKKYKPGDLTKAMVKKFADDGVNKKDCKAAIRELVDNERLVYSYFNGTFLEIPHVEGAAKSD